MVDNTPSIVAGGQKPIWSRTWFVILAGIAFAGAIILADQFGEAGNTEWMIIFALALALASGQFWGKRSRCWFWPSVIGLGLVHGAMILHWKWTEVPAPGAINLKGAVFSDLALDCAWLWWMGWLFDPHMKPRTPASVQVEVILYAFVAILVAIVALTWWGIEKRQREVIEHSRVVMEAMSAQNLASLKRCFFNGPHADDVWSKVPGNYPSERMSDAVFHTSVIIGDLGSKRKIQVTTLDGNPVPKDQAAKFSRCAGRMKDR